MKPRLFFLPWLLAGLVLSVAATEIRMRVDRDIKPDNLPQAADACAPVADVSPEAPPADYTAALVTLARHTAQLDDLRLALDTLVRTADPRVFGADRVPVLGEGWSRIGEARERVRVQSWDGTDEGNRVRPQPRRATTPTRGPRHGQDPERNIRDDASPESRGAHGSQGLRHREAPPAVGERSDRLSRARDVSARLRRLREYDEASVRRRGRGHGPRDEPAVADRVTPAKGAGR